MLVRVYPDTGMVTDTLESAETIILETPVIVLLAAKMPPI